MTKPWGGAGAWAADSELAETQQEQPSVFSNDAAFPSLGEAVSTKVPKKKKGQTLSLSEFTTGVYVGPGARSGGSFTDSKGLTPGELLMLPTGPRDRSDEDPAPFGGLGGGFKDYGGYRGGRDNGDGRDRDGGRYGSGRSDRDGGYRMGGFGGDRDRGDEPSRADTHDDWGASKKFTPSLSGQFDSDRRRGNRVSDRDFTSKADDDDHWGTSKKYVPPLNSGEHRRGSGRFEDFPSRGSGFHDHSGLSKADQADNWGSSKKFMFSGGFDSLHRDRDFGLSKDSDTDSWSRRDSERPRLVLQPRSRPADSSLTPAAPGNDNLPKAEDTIDPSSKPRKVNPFGEAKPREVILEEKGKDWRKLDADLELKSPDRVETEEELSLKGEIKALQAAIKSKDEGSTEEAELESLQNLEEQLVQKKQELEQLTALLNEKARLSGAWNERPSSRSGIRESGSAWGKSHGNGSLVIERKGGRW